MFQVDQEDDQGKIIKKIVHYVNLQIIQNYIKITSSQLLLLDKRAQEKGAKTKLLTTIPQVTQLVENVNLENLIPYKNSRTKRRLINGIGTIFKWFFGTLDNNDREN